mmetsp:Transcript_12709/g.28840  ORF Transcript_12709/g.28840 Transcript_12709/m.28840 type:complete len:887 (+) Transcript_12709:72-2732(+)
MGRSGGRFYELLKDLRQEHSKDVKELQEQLSRASQALQEALTGKSLEEIVQQLQLEGPRLSPSSTKDSVDDSDDETDERIPFPGSHSGSTVGSPQASKPSTKGGQPLIARDKSSKINFRSEESRASANRKVAFQEPMAPGQRRVSVAVISGLPGTPRLTPLMKKSTSMMNALLPTDEETSQDDGEEGEEVGRGSVSDSQIESDKATCDLDSSKALELKECWVHVLQSDDMVVGQPASAPSQRGQVRMQRPATGRTFFLGTNQNAWLNPKRYIANPAAPLRQVWDFSGLFLLTLDLVITPLQLFDLPDYLFFRLMRYVTATFWTLDIIASFLVGYHHNGDVEYSPKKIAMNYIRSWFCLDCTLAAIDWSILIMGEDSQASSALRLGKVSRFMRAVRLLRLVKIRNMLEEVQGVLRSEFKRTVFYISKLITFIVCVNHFVACGFYGLKSWKPERHSLTWVEVRFTDEDSLAYRYSTSLHWSLTQFTPASMEVVPVNEVERFYTVMVLLMALVTFSSFVSSITTAMTHLREINQQKLQKETRLMRYLDEHEISKRLRARVLHYIQERSMLQQQQAKVKESEVDLFKVLPDSMKNDLRCEAWMPTLLKHPFMFQYHATDEQAMCHLCRVAISERRLLVREELYGHSRPVTHMLFVLQGILSYSYFSEGHFSDKKINQEQWCAECCLWSDSEWLFEACMPFVAETNAELVLLDAEELANLVPKYPGTAYRVACYGVYYLQMASQAAQNGCVAQVPIMGADQDELLELAHQAFEETNEDDELESEPSDDQGKDPHAKDKDKWSFGALLGSARQHSESKSPRSSKRRVSDVLSDVFSGTHSERMGRKQSDPLSTNGGQERKLSSVVPHPGAVSVPTKSLERHGSNRSTASITE